MLTQYTKEMRNDFIVENCDENYNEIDGEVDSSDEKLSKRPRPNEDDKLQKCRERNRIHARNTRERKRAQMDLLQLRIQELSNEKRQLEDFEPETSVASILMSLSNCSRIEDNSLTTMTNDMKAYIPEDPTRSYIPSTVSDADALVERLRFQISATLSDDEDFELNPELLLKDKTACSTAELETIRRERNRMHAKKTRLRKKKMLNEMETIITNLEADIRQLKQKHNLSPEQFPSCVDQLPSAGGTSRALVGHSKFTGFRHMQMKSSGGSTTGAMRTPLNPTVAISGFASAAVNREQQSQPIMNTVSSDSTVGSNSPTSSSRGLYPSSSSYPPSSSALPSGFPPLVSGFGGRLHFPLSMGGMKLDPDARTGMDYNAASLSGFTTHSSSNNSSSSTITGSSHSSSNGSITSQLSPFPSCADLSQRLSFTPYPDGLLPPSVVMGSAQLARDGQFSGHSYTTGTVNSNSSRVGYPHYSN